jgi:hypothetical protein
MSFSTSWTEQVEFDNIDTSGLAAEARASLDKAERVVVHLRVDEVRLDGAAVISFSDRLGVYQHALIRADGSFALL